jgi:hypothetical protein
VWALLMWLTAGLLVVSFWLIVPPMQLLVKSRITVPSRRCKP